jgi:hypothetical protein
MAGSECLVTGILCWYASPMPNFIEISPTVSNMKYVERQAQLLFHMHSL